ncbi:MAG: cell division protein FtsZ [Nitrospirae bacterium]|nr:cell division protein FtsZ [Nitrospirota bacterium]
MFELEEIVGEGANIKVVGVGGGGCNAVDRMIASQLRGVEFVAINTDAQALARSKASVRLQIGTSLTKGLGVGANPDKGRDSALEDADRMREIFGKTDMVFITAGMGGGTGTGAAPVIADLARQMGILTVAVVTKPFHWEGHKRMQNAEEGLENLRKHVDTMIVIPNQRLLGIVDRKITMLESFNLADDVLRQAVQGISDLITCTGLVNVDFADVRTIMSYTGRAVMGMGTGIGENRAVEAAQKAVSNPLLEEGSIEGARGVLINVTGGSDLSLYEVTEASTIIHNLADEKANIIFGCVIDDSLEDQVMITVMATGFERSGSADEKMMTKALAIDSLEPVSKTLDRPTFLRKVNGSDYRNESMGIEGDEWDAPAFLRKKGDSGEKTVGR